VEAAMLDQLGIERLGAALDEALNGAVLDWDPDESSYGIFLIRRALDILSTMA
jgi:hypothetical protein